MSLLPDNFNRVSRARPNAVESLALFAAVELAASTMGTSDAVTVACAETYLCARVAHALIHLSGSGRFKSRTRVFTVAWLAFVILAAEALHIAFR